jgi:hypothetical protein
VLTPAGLDAAKDIITVQYEKDPTDPTWRNDQGYKDCLAWMNKYYPEGDKTDAFNVTGYNRAMTMVQVLKQCGDDLTRANVMKQAANLKNFEQPMLLPGIKVNTSASDFYPLKQEQLAKFNGKTWELFGNVLAMNK